MLNTHKFWPAVFMTLLVAVAGAFLASLASPVRANSVLVATGDYLEIEISGVRNDEGSVVVLVFDDEQAWNTSDFDSIIDYREIDATTAPQKMKFSNLTEGPYAIAMWHDEDSDGEFGEMAGYPTEGWGMSGAKGMYDEPGWSQARVAPGLVSIRMHYIE